MSKLSFSDNLAIGGIAFTILLVVLDKAGKLKGPLLLILLAIAALMLLPLAWGNSWVSEATGIGKLSRALFTFFLLGLIYSGIAIWISTGEESTAHGPTASEIADELSKRLAKSPQSETSQNKSGLSAPTPQATQPFVIEVENSALRADSSDWITGFWFKYRIPGVDVLVPTNMMLFLRFTNLQSHDVFLAGYRVEMKVDHTWKQLTKLDIHTAVAYNAYPARDHPTIQDSLKVAWLHDFSENGIDEQLLRKEGKIAANGIVRGWAFFQYPLGISGLTGMEPLRVTLSDVAGRTQQHIHTRAEELQSNQIFGQSIKKLAGGPFDISGMQIRRWPLGEPLIKPQ